MMDSDSRYELRINNRTVKTPIALASMAGITDASYAMSIKDYIGIAFIGGYSIDEPSMNASIKMEEEGRQEFKYDDPAEELKKQVSKFTGTDVIPGINLRGTKPEAFLSIYSALGNSVIYEIDAHCRQEPMINAGAGEYLLKNTDTLSDIIRALKEAGATVSVKIRAGVNDDDAELSRIIWKAGADIIHVDLMDFGHEKIRQIRNSCPLMIIANNSMDTYDKVKDMFSHGADMISLARNSDPKTLESLFVSIEDYADESGWYNSPKQLCRGGDIRSLTFCCMPVKQCALIPALKRIGMSPKEFNDLKLSLVKDTPLASGDSTCFGSLAWCCKSSTPCMFRDMSLKRVGLSHSEYMRLKHHLSKEIMKKVFDEKNEA
ncbi:methanogenesis marker 9 domain-containing protein [Methanomicrobium antiquum]|uniref:Methanogenesis marker 9 domain-containing protein n=1 Tax=Methanomicrobium antiquum TaxID=487686 RepID=A0AAF0FQL6_9EURY|nr:methanogenesis marker 9 domain-containing protein [Methanomicrobium antiquum]WFN37920.1 methanogenesis marker 9 domain-containing protein [Methanomicrobium antiquum]